MDSRRDFIKKAALLSGAAGLSAILPPSILKAMAIDPAIGSTYLDAEHIVILMQENRSFDHMFGTLQGVRGFNDPRAVQMPSGLPVWFQQNKKQETFVPFRLDMKSKATWMGDLPHSWTNQVDARNNGHHDRWLHAKPSGYKGFEEAPLTLGYYNREDLPFYYALADAFTICDQNFCSSLTGTTPNRLFLWAGNVRGSHETTAPAIVRNENLDYEREANWHTFPELLQDNGISWKIYQNEVSLSTGLSGEEDSWLANFTDNPIEWFKQYNVRYLDNYQQYAAKRVTELPTEIADLEKKAATLTAGSTDARNNANQLSRKQKQLAKFISDRQEYTPENYAKLSKRQQELHQRAFCTNKKDKDYRSLTTISYKDGDKSHEVSVPKGDVLYQFRDDVKTGNLPTVSWLVAPERFSDHPTSPWYGAWYVSEVMDILTKDPEIWKKTVFILCYDENDGYFDHVPPFVPPHPDKPETGKVSAGMRIAHEHVSLAEDRRDNPTKNPKDTRESPIGLGYRVPLLIASPWSRGGAVCSQVFDHTSIVQFMEHFLSHKTGRTIREQNISDWRRTICGNLTSVFKTYNGEKINFPASLNQHETIRAIHRTQFKAPPSGFRKLSPQEVNDRSFKPEQEPGVRRSVGLPYKLISNLKINKENVQIQLASGDSGAPFTIYNGIDAPRNYAVKAKGSLSDTFNLVNDKFDLRVHGPNGFFRHFTGEKSSLNVAVDYVTLGTHLLVPAMSIEVENHSKYSAEITITDNSYGEPAQMKKVSAGEKVQFYLEVLKSSGWYDLTVKCNSNKYRYAGRIDDAGTDGTTDPAIGRKPTN